VPQVNCYIPIKLRITGRLSDSQLDGLSDTLVRALAARISFAERTIAKQQALFRNIDLLLASGSSDDLEKAAELPAELNATAFGPLDSDRRVRYVSVLVRTWKSDPQEKAIVEIFKSVSDKQEREIIIRKLRKTGLWEQLFDNLDGDLYGYVLDPINRFDSSGRRCTQTYELSSVLQINRYIPIKVCITSPNGDAQLEQLGQTLTRAPLLRL
jgi:hypothetical protein